MFKFGETNIVEETFITIVKTLILKKHTFPIHPKFHCCKINNLWHQIMASNCKHVSICVHVQMHHQICNHAQTQKKKSQLVKDVVMVMVKHEAMEEKFQIHDKD
jgi:hypothetical protein